MKKTLFTLCFYIILSILNTPLSAKEISIEEAQKVANFFISLDDQWHGSTEADVRLVEHNGTPAYYVIEYNNGGWIIVSAQSSSNPIIGYSTEGKYAAPEPMELLLDINAKIITARATAGELEHKAWKRLKQRKVADDINTTPNIAPLIKINLNQSAPFNNHCPEIKGVKPLVGCVAVGMTQAIMVQRYPKAPTGQYSYHDKNRGTISINYDKEKPYDWDGMYNGNTDEIARLAYHCGVSVEMDYGINASGTITEYVATALTRNFGYDKNTIRYITKKNNRKEWLDIILGELSEGRAVVYRGESGAAGHCWNVDGWKQSTQMIHCNWGWGGIGNGYFSINNMTDSYQGMGFLYSHAAIIGIGAPTTVPYDILLSNTQIALGIEPGEALADVEVLCGDKDAKYKYELYCSKGIGETNTPSPYKIENGKLVSTRPIANDNSFKHLYIKVTNTNNGMMYEKAFKLYITSANAKDLEGTYTAKAQEGIETTTNSEWQVNITIDENDSNKVWFQPICLFIGLKAQHVKPIYAIYDAVNKELTMPLGQLLFKQSGYKIVNAISNDSVGTVTSGEIVLKANINDTEKTISFASDYYFGVCDANNNYKWHKTLSEINFVQEQIAPLDIQLSNTQYTAGTEAGIALADVIITGNNPDDVITFEILGAQDDNCNYTASPYEIVDGTLVSRTPIKNNNEYKHLYIKAHNTTTGKWVEKYFYIDIIDLNANMIAGQFNAFSRDAYDDTPIEWKVNITVDENDPNKVWIHPLYLFNGLTANDILPVYATIDTISNILNMPLGQVIYEDNNQKRYQIYITANGLRANTVGNIAMFVNKDEEGVDMSFAYNYYMDIIEVDTEEGRNYPIFEVVFTNRDEIVIDSVYYKINETDKTAQTTYRGSNHTQYRGEYDGDVVIPATITYKNTDYIVNAIGKQTFYNCAELTSVTISQTVATIGDEAFAWCSNLSQITTLATIPPTIDIETFKDVDRSIPVKVPNGCVEAYQNAPYWNEFTNIIDDNTGIDTIINNSIKVTIIDGSITIKGCNDNVTVKIYSFCGVLLHNTVAKNVANITLPQGVYLVQIDNTTHKVVI